MWNYKCISLLQSIVFRKLHPKYLITPLPQRSWYFLQHSKKVACIIQILFELSAIDIQKHRQWMICNKSITSNKGYEIKAAMTTNKNIQQSCIMKYGNIKMENRYLLRSKQYMKLPTITCITFRIKQIHWKASPHKSFQKHLSILTWLDCWRKMGICDMKQENKIYS